MSLSGPALGITLAVLLAGISYALGALTAMGALAAAIVGGLTMGLGGIPPAVLLILFFISSSALSRAGLDRKHSLRHTFSKGGRRDLGQVFANGGLPAIFAVGYGLTNDTAWLAAAAGALAAVNADTWATELGVLSRRRPRLITTWAPVPAGTSGAVTLEGSLASLGGAITIAVPGAILDGGVPLALGALLGGLLGAHVDSLLGATLQGIFFCPTCDSETERHPQHHCGTETQPLRGWTWLRNDGVNLAASCTGGITGLLLWRLLAL